MVVLGSRKPLKTVARVAKNPAIEIVYFNLHLKMNANMISLTTGVGVQDGKGHAESENNDLRRACAVNSEYDAQCLQHY